MAKHVLTIAGSDSGGGAGIQADLKVFSALGTYGMSVITAVTAQNTERVLAIQEIDPEIVKAQLEAIFTDIRVDAVKVGMVFSAEIAKVIADSFRKYRPSKVVVDPVMIAKSGDRLLREDAIETLKTELFPLATLITPNLPEAEALLGRSISSIDEMRSASKELSQLYQTQVLLKGGHLPGKAIDILSSGRTFIAERIDTKHTHGTGCSLSSAIAAHLALGYPLEEAIERSKRYISEAIQYAFPIGKGHSPIHHFYHWEQKRKEQEND